MASIRRVLGRWLRLRRRLKRFRRAYQVDPTVNEGESPFRAQLFSGEQMETYGRSLAHAHRVRMEPTTERLLERLQSNQKVLADANDLLNGLVRDELTVSPAGEWLLDNYHVIEEQIQLARRHLPRGYSRQLPSLSHGPLRGFPRVYALSIEAVSHGDGRIDAETLRRFITAYQTVAPLKMGELWAVPIMLRLALIENLRRMASRVMSNGADRRLAHTWAHAVNRAAAESPNDVVLIVADLARSTPPLSGAFVSELTRRLDGRTGPLALPSAWLDQWVIGAGYRIEELVATESQQQATDQVSISNSIGSLRFLATMDWKSFVEDMSVVDKRLRDDPAGVYPHMDFGTRDAYRHVVEKIARSSGATEEEVAGVTVALARTHGTAPRSAHVGYWLLDAGRDQTLDVVAKAAPGYRRARLSPMRYPLSLYLLPIVAIVAVATWALASIGHGPVPLLGVVVLAALVFSELGIVLVNWLATLLVPPRPLPRMDFSQGIPEGAAAVVAVPTMLSSSGGLDALVEGLEVRFLANRESNLRFVLLTDFLDAKQQTLPQDEALLAYASAEIEKLNRRYAPESLDRFYLLHRPRLWNPAEGVWMGYERKRGKLAALNGLILAGETSPFMRIVGDPAALRRAKYVITLDTDTRLPRDAAREFVATLAHPLNQPELDAQRGVIAGGYGILQPSVGSSLSGRRPSRFAALFGSEPGIDPYTRTVSDVYQDLFGEGSFVGKGIYDVAAFERVLDGRLPENRILSHDLLEGCFARAGLVSDVRLYEDYPDRYSVDTKRRVRWTRGDWQLIPWLLPWVPNGSGAWEPNPLSWLSRGKLLDNLRRSLVPLGGLALLLVGWVYAPQPAAWTMLVLALWFLPVLAAALKDGVMLPEDTPAESHWVQVGRVTVRGLQRAALNVACLAHEAWLASGAIVRTLWRLVVSRRHLLQWNPSSEVERSLASDRSADWRGMLPGSVFAVAVALLLLWLRPDVLAIAGPLLLAWMWAPAVMTWMSQAPEREDAALDGAERAFLGRLSRRTWSFFETWVRQEDHWLPPDNIQEHPSLVVARRTSPTNIGLSLLANLAAWDFGYLQASGVAERTRNVFATLDQLPRYRGHFLNWYDTATLQPLYPRYVSTVDSGNLAGHLLTLRQGLLGLIDAPLLAPATLEGIGDTFGVVEDEVAALAARSAAIDSAMAAFRSGLAALIERPATTAASLLKALASLEALAQDLLRAWPVPASLDAGDRHWPQVLREACGGALEELHALLPAPASGDAPPPDQALPSLRELATRQGDAPASKRARERINELERLAHLAGQYSLMEYGFLYDRSRHLLAVGFNVDDHRLDNSFYDLLASEVRLGVFVAIAQSQLPQDSWFALGRLLTEVNGTPALLSWSGSMFEYLMPQLVMPGYPDTLLDQTMRNAVEAHILYGKSLDVPWGVSESGYNAVDTRMNYQYRAFGVPGLGLKRGLSQDNVVAPYASMMALMVNAEAACENLQQLQALGFSGRFGMYEAIDYTPSRVPPGQEHVLLRSFMAHHQGMGFLSLVYLLRDEPMQRRFVADAEFQATLLLLQERIPKVGVFHPHESETLEARATAVESEPVLRILREPDGPRPEIQLLSNGRYHGMVSHAGGGYSRHRDMATTRWREDGTTDAWGTFCYLRDVDSGEFWSAAHQPTCVPVDQYEAIFSDAKAEFRGRKQGYESHLEIAISPEDDMELRRLKIANRSRRPRTVEITTYAEVVLAPAASDDAHPAFSNLFVQTEIVREKQALLCTRRARAHDEIPPWLVHLVAVHDADVIAISYESDRSRFVGRGHTTRAPKALTVDETLADSEGSVLDPVIAIRVRVSLQPEQVAQIDMVYGVAETRQACETLIDKYRDRRLADRVFDLAWTHSQVVRRQINASKVEAQLYERLASLVVYAHAHLRAPAAVLSQNQRGQSGLWGHAISGDLPIVLLKVHDADNIEIVRQLVQAHGYWRLKGLRADLVIWNDSKAGYRQQLQDQILGMISADADASVLDRPGGIFVRPAQNMSQEDRTLLQAVARVLIDDREGTLSAQLGRMMPPDRLPGTFSPTQALDADHAYPASTVLLPHEHAHTDIGIPDPWKGDEDEQEMRWPFLPLVDQKMAFDNGIGAFTEDGREYVIVSREGAPTPAPWSNVLANEEFGCVVSESGTGYTWFENAHEYRLTPWNNDPVSDASGEAFYLRDEESGLVWSPTPNPCRGKGSYRTRHGFGYTVYEHQERDVHTELWVFVGVEDAIKYSVLRVSNTSENTRRLAAFGYVEWVLGDLRPKSRMHVVTEVDPVSGALLAHNPFNTEFAGRTVFFDTDASGCSWTADRVEFIGRNGSLEVPAAVARERLSGRTGVGLDPCAAIQVPLEIAAGATVEIAFRLGAAKDREGALALARRAGSAHGAADALDGARIHWRGVLDSIQVRTPDPAFDALANGWLLYQTLGCRFLARSGYYQSGGAFGFRDQLQDTMATIHARPDLSRRHLLTSAAHQFPQGDVMHWWHPPQGRGVRTRCSDDFLWLPQATSRYLEVTADGTVLDEVVGFVEGRTVAPEEEGYYDMPATSSLKKTLYDHCVLALRRGCSLLGDRGIPLIATGDWNDGMNRVGEGGKGESVWLGFFLVDTLRRFQPIAKMREDTEFAQWCADQVQSLSASLETHAWDGRWYRRAWFDDGTPIGSSDSDECRIDSISQSWSVLSGVADPPRGEQALASLYEHLVRPDAGLIQLLDPPFDKTTHDPGYIRGYVPGVRENGGQYTHAAVWAAMAFAEQGHSERAWELTRMINPINHALTEEGVFTYKVEPYVMAADVYAVSPHEGRGGWTWYTGSAGWMYRLLIESVLGLRRKGHVLTVDPRIPAGWERFEMRYRFGGAVYQLDVERGETNGTSSLHVDGELQPALEVHLMDDQKVHRAQYVIVGGR